jgi:hypothetical protein
VAATAIAQPASTLELRHRLVNAAFEPLELIFHSHAEPQKRLEGDDYFSGGCFVA